MKIIFASKFYYRRGGLEAYLFKAKDLLESRGHTVIPFSTDCKDNISTAYAKYFCKYYDISRINKFNFKANLEAFLNMFFNRQAYDKIGALIEDEKPDILQGFGVTKHLSGSIFKAARQKGIATIMRLSDLALFCPASLGSCGCGKVCEDLACAGAGLNLKIVRYKCIQNSLAASAIGLLETKINRILDYYRKYVDYFIAPSEFIKQMYIKHYGVAADKIGYLPVFFDAGSVTPSGNDKGYFLYAGRIDKSKGIAALLEAFKELPHEKLLLAGDGPERLQFEDYARQHKINSEFLGFQQQKELNVLLDGCRALILPSFSYENSPNIVLEAFSYNKPVIASDIGGIPELVRNEVNGLLFAAGDPEQLAGKVECLAKNIRKANELGVNGRNFLIRELNPQSHYERLMEIYKKVKR